MDKTQQAVNVFNKLANEYQAKFMDVSVYHESLDLFCESILKKNAQLLDIACGPGNMTRYLLDKRPDFKITGIDLAPNMLALANQNNPDADFLLMDAKDIKTIKKKWDGIMCGFCFPYLSKEEAILWIGDAVTLLNPGGVLYISTMEDDYTNSAYKKGSAGDEIFMHYHQADYLSTALIENKLEIMEVQRKYTAAMDGATTCDLILISRK